MLERSRHTSEAAAPAPETPVPPMPRDRLLFLATALAGSLLINLSGQFVGANISDIQAGIGASADEGSWLTTVYTMALFGGIVCAAPMIAAFGLRRYMAAGALLFALAALGNATAPALPVMVALRAAQGFAAGGFGPVAFVGVFMTTGGPRLPFGLSLLALVLLLPGTIGPALSGLVEDRLGWEALFLVQAAIGAGLAAAAILFMPRAPIDWQALRRDWTALILLSLALAASLLVLGQGTRRFWLDSPTIAWSLAVAAGAWAGFLLTVWRSPAPILDVSLLARRSFMGPISLNLLFRAGFAGISYLVPQFLTVVQGYRPLELGTLFLWAAVPQLAAFPITWWLIRRTERRLVAAAGLVLFGLGAMLASHGTSLAAADQFHLAMMAMGAGQVLFLVPNLVAGAGSLKPADGPTASLLFNASTVGGTSIGVALATELVTERQKFHVGALAEGAAAYGPKSGLIEGFAAGLASRVADDALAGARTFASIAASLRREAWVLSFNEGFLIVGALLVAGALGLLFLHRQPPLRGAPAIVSGGSS